MRSKKCGDAEGGETTSQAEGRSTENVDIAYAGTLDVICEEAMRIYVPMLSKINYPLWAMRMEVTLEANGLLEAVRVDLVNSIF